MQRAFADFDDFWTTSQVASVGPIIAAMATGDVERLKARLCKRVCTGALQTLVSHTDAFDTDPLCIRLLAEHQLVDLGWLRKWLEFKRERLERLTLLAQEVAAELKSHGPTDVSSPQRK